MIMLADVLESLSGLRSVGMVQTIRRFVIDSREAKPKDVFVALKGDDTDGHLHVADAFSRGAIAALVDREVDVDAAIVDLEPGSTAPQSLPLPVCLRVADVLTALQSIATWWRDRFPTLRVIGITGSVGKSSTKELTAAVLSRHYNVLKNEGNLNNEIGLPLTLLRLEQHHQRAVLEMGMYARGEIATLCEIAKPVIGVETIVGPIHLERLGTIEAIAQAKAELVEALPADGVAILNYDEPLVRQMADQTDANVLYYGLSPQADLWADEIHSEGLNGIRFQLHHHDETMHVRVPLLGRHSVHTALRAAAVGVAEGLLWDQILSGLQDRHAVLRLVAVPGPNGSTLLDDTYNASSESTIAALNLLDDLEGRKIAVLGGMLELGTYETREHRKVALRTIDVADVLVTVGQLGMTIANVARRQGMSSERIHACESNDEAIALLREIIEQGDMVLVKGSRGLHMETIVHELGEG